MYDLIARTAGLMLIALFFAAFLWGRLPLPAPWFVRRFWEWSLLRRAAFIVGVLFFLMLVIEWASQHRQVR